MKLDKCRKVKSRRNKPPYRYHIFVGKFCTCGREKWEKGYSTSDRKDI